MKFSVDELDFGRSPTKNHKAENAITFPAVNGAADSGLWFYHTVNETFYGWTGVQWTPLGGEPIVPPVSGIYVDGSGATIVPEVFQAGQLRIGTLNPAPTLATDPGVTNEVRWDANYIYLCVGTNQWKRAALTTW